MDGALDPAGALELAAPPVDGHAADAERRGVATVRAEGEMVVETGLFDHEVVKTLRPSAQREHLLGFAQRFHVA